MITFQESYTKTQRLAKDNNSDTLIQLKQDWNTGYHMFNAKLARYYSRKQQFTNLIAGQQIYQTPVDSVRIGGMTIVVTNTYQIPVKEIRSEYDWRMKTSYPYQSNWPMWYFVIGNDLISLWPIPSQSVTNGMRYWYQPQDHDLSIDDLLSTSTNTVTVTNGSNIVTSASSAFNPNISGMQFQLTGIPDLTWYEIEEATSNTLTLKSAFIGTSASAQSWRVAQVSIIPQEYQDAPMHYALANYWSSQGNEARSNQHMTLYNALVTACEEDYSSSTESSVITEDDNEGINIWQVPPPASQM